MRSIRIRRLGVADAADYRAIRLCALRSDPDSFGSVYGVESAHPIAAFEERLATSVVLGAYAEEQLIGMAGFKQESGEKDRHKGFVWGFYVRANSRAQGIGEALLNAIFEAARETVEQLTLSVVQGNEAALNLYRKFGFEVYGIEPRALKGPAGYSDEILMVRMLSAQTATEEPQASGR